jgi:DNA-binding transcriptional LysR family regulator
LLERSTRNLRLTELGAEILEQATRSAELSETVESIVSNRLSDVSGTLRLSVMPSVSETLLTPLITAFQASYPNVRVQVLVTERMVDLVAEGVDLVFRLGSLRDSSLVARKILTYRHQLVASPSYLNACKPPERPQDLLDHRLLSFSYWKSEGSWTFIHKNGEDRETLTFQPYLSMNDFAGLAPALAAGGGIGDLPPIVQPNFMRDGRLVEVMPDWRFRTFDLSIVHVGSRHMSKPCRLFKELATEIAPSLFPNLPG